MKRKAIFIIFSVVALLFIIHSASAWTTAKRITWNSGFSQSPNVDTDSNNNIHVIWEDDTPGNYEIFHKKSMDGGVSWSAPVRITWNSGTSWGSAMFIDSGDTIHLVWNDDTTGNFEMYYKKSIDGGNSWTTTKRLTYNSGISSYSSVAVNSGNIIHVVWSDNWTGNNEIYHKRSTDGGIAWSATKRLIRNTGESTGASMVINSTNDLHIVWADDSSGNKEILYKKSTDDGYSWSVIKRLTWTSGQSFTGCITSDSGNNLHLVWYDYTPGNGEIFYKKSTDSGVTWSSTKRLTYNTGDSLEAKIAADSSNHLHVVWYDYTPNYPEIFYKKSTNGGAAWSTPVRITWNSGDSLFSNMAIDSADTIHIVWYDDTPGNFEIFYKKN